MASTMPIARERTFFCVLLRARFQQAHSGAFFAIAPVLSSQMTIHLFATSCSVDLRRSCGNSNRRKKKEMGQKGWLEYFFRTVPAVMFVFESLSLSIFVTAALVCSYDNLEYVEQELGSVIYLSVAIPSHRISRSAPNQHDAQSCA